MLADHPSARPTARQVLHHPLLTRQTSQQAQAMDDIIKRRIAQLASLRHVQPSASWGPLPAWEGSRAQRCGVRAQPLQHVHVCL